MTDFLASFNLGEQAPPSNSSACGSVEELRMRLRGLLDTKATVNRVEHVTTTVELGATVQFTLSLSHSENKSLENLNNIDPSLGGTRSTTSDQAGGQLSRTVDANETLMNQPQDNPILQRSVAKHIISAVSATDGSTWTDSYQQWSRQNAKTHAKAVVGEYSLKDLDPTLGNRPAFDCRGSITIAFNRNSRSIMLKYDHTPLHKTVAELAAYWRPPPRQLGPGALKQQKAPKRQKKAQDENGNPRKKQKTNADAKPTASGDPVTPPDYPGAAPVERPSQAGPSYDASPPQPSIEIEQLPPGIQSYPQKLVDAPPLANSRIEPRYHNSQPPPSMPVNVSPAEAARRRDVAAKMLRDAGVDPTSLSAEQFIIFSNQAPELQKDSLAMLVKYGAERLRIVHPSNREGSASGPSSSPKTQTQAGQATAPEPAPVNQSMPPVGQSRTSSAETENAPAYISNENLNTQGIAELHSAQITPSTVPRMGRSRTACFACKRNRVKCPRERPVCTECRNNGLDCEYAPQRPRKRKSQAATSTDINMEDEEVEQKITREQQDAVNSASHPRMAVADTPTSGYETDQQANDYWRQEPALPVSHAEVSTLSQPAYTTSSSLILPHGQAYSAPVTETNHTISDTQPGHQQMAASQSQTSSPEQSRQTGQALMSQSRQTPKSGASLAEYQTSSSGNSQSPDWPAVSGNMAPMAPIATMSAISPVAAHTTVAIDNNRSRPSNHPASTDAGQLMDGMQTARALSMAAIQNSQRSPKVTPAVQAGTQRSPFPRTNPRQSQSGQSRTPATEQPMARGYQPPPQSNQHTAAEHGGNSTDYGYGHYNNLSSGTSHQAADKAGHEHYSQQRPASTTQSSPNRGQNAAIASSITSQAPSIMATSYQPAISTSNQWPNSQGRNTNTRLQSYNNKTSSAYNSQASYAQPSGSDRTSSLQNFDRRGATQSAQSSTSNAYAQQHQQQQNYHSFQAQQQARHTPNQQNNWLHFQGSNNSSSQSRGNTSGYSW